MIAVKTVIEGLGSEALQQPVRFGVTAPVQRAEATRVAEAKRLARIEFEIEMIVHASRRAAVDDEHATGHAQVHDGRAAGSIDQEVLGAAADGYYRGADEIFLDVS